MLRGMVKPFLLKCHPDVQRTDDAKTINLSAIQHLNSYLDTVQTILSAHSLSKRTQEPSTRIFEVDFMMTLPEQTVSSGRAKKLKKLKVEEGDAPTSRRKVELALPPLDLCRRLASLPHGPELTELRDKVQRHSSIQLVRLLKVASLPVPKDLDTEAENEDGNMQDFWSHELGLDQQGQTRVSRFDFVENEQQRAYHQNRERFTRSINWKKFDALYKKAVADMKADFATEGLIKDHTGRRRSTIANILSKLRLQEETDPVQQLVAIRRLSLLLDEHFETLSMEEFGRLWESCKFVLTPERQYNTSSSALHKRRLQRADTGFSFTLHPDFSVTIEIPIDFRDDELIQELERNVWDIYDLLEADDGFESIFSEFAV
jgi:hypothetical protein